MKKLKFITKWSWAPLSHCINVPLIAPISCGVSCIDLELGTNDEEDITQQIILLCISISMLELFNISSGAKDLIREVKEA